MTSAGADFGILGPLTITVAGTPVHLSSAKARIVLACLLLQPNRVVSVEELVDRLWDDAPPKGARNAAQSYVMRLRNALGDAGSLIRTHSTGYLIAVSPEMVDIGRFRARVTAAETARPEAAADELRVALAMWRGAPLADVPSESLRVHTVTRVDEERLQALERLMDVELALGRHAELVGELYAITAQNPLRERFWGQLMLALHRSQRQAEALGVYQKVSRLLRDELGIDPGEALRELHQRVLASDPVVPAQQADAWTAPFQLPADVPDFVGRDDLLARIGELTTGPGRLAVPVAVLSGPPGAGKTALAVHAAHLLRPEFPDGQLYVNLRGYSTSPPLAATDALARFLRALGVAPERIPHDIDEQSTLLRSLLGGRRVFMILDNASSPEQVRPLLPSDPSCAVLITSRNNLQGLTALNGARRFPVGVVSADEAKAMVTNIVGADRVDAEPEATGALATVCGHLPLSLRIASTNLAGSEDQSIAEYVRVLGSGRLDAMRIDGDSEAAVRPAFDLSYTTLKPTLSQFLRMLGLIPGPDFDRLAASAVAGVDEPTAQRMLDQLTSMNLIGGATGRRAFHDLIKEFVLERVRDQDTPAERGQAAERLFAFYLHWTYAACRAQYPDAYLRPPSYPIGIEPAWEDESDALKWLDAEAENLLAMIGTGAAYDLPVWELADTLWMYLNRRRHQSAWKSAFAAALAAAEHAGDTLGQARVHAGIGRMYLHHAQFAEVEEHTTRAAELFREIGDVIGEARARNTLGATAIDLGGDYDSGLRHYEEALRLFGDDLDPVGQSVAMFNLAMTLIFLGEETRGRQGVAQCQELASRLGLRILHARCEYALAYSDMCAGRLSTALRGFDQALTTFAEVRYLPGTIEMVVCVAEIALDAGQPGIAADIGQWALAKAAEVDYAWLVVGSQLVLGKAALETDDIDTAMRHLRAAEDLETDGKRYWASAIRQALAACHRRAGRLTEAAALASAVTADRLPRDRGRAHTELAAILLAQGDHVAAAAHARQAVKIAETHGYSLDLAQALLMFAAATGEARDDQRRAETLVETGLAGVGPVLSALAARVPTLDQR